jgi:hypothetical protein
VAWPAARCWPSISIAARCLFDWHDIKISDGQISVAAVLKKHELLALAVRAGLRVHRPWSRLSLVAPV